jgi:hypothetical protein
MPPTPIGANVYQETLTLVSSVTSTQGGLTQTSYARKDINYNITNLFQHAIFYQGQLHLHRGFKVMGPVHTNGNLILNAHGGDHAVYNGMVAAGNRFYRGSCMTGDQTGNFGTNAFGLVPELPASDANHGDLDPAQFKTVATGSGDGTQDTTTSTLASAFSGDIPIYISTLSPGNFRYRFVNLTTDSRLSTSAWSTAMNSSTAGFNNCLQDKFASVPVPIINPIGSSGYNMNADGTATNSPYFLIEPLLPKTHTLRVGTSSSPSQKTNYRYNLSANASLVLRVEFAARDMDGVLITQANTGAHPRPAINPNLPDMSTSPTPNASWYCPTSAYGAPPLLAPLPQSQNPANYIVRAYKKPVSISRATEPSDREAIPFPTDVIGRADYHRIENGTSSTTYDYAAGVDSQPIDILGTEAGITVATAATTTAVAGRVSAERVISTDSRLTTTATSTNSYKGTSAANRVREEAWHRYHIETYYPVTTAASAAAYTSSPIQYYAGYTNRVPVLPGIGTPIDPWGVAANATTHTAAMPVPAATATGATASFPLYGLHDSRLGRGVHLLTLDISRLKEIMEEPIANVLAKYGAEANQFRLAFNNGTSEWNGIIYVEFPTSTTVIYDPANPGNAVNPAPGAVAGSVPTAYYGNATMPENNAHTSDTATDSTHPCYLDTYLFAYAPVGLPNTVQGAETRYPLRTSDTTTIGRKDQTVPIAQEFRRYPSTVDSKTITDPANAILALQVINAKRLPRVTTSKFDATSSNTLNCGFTLATNAPLYLVGSWNSDGDYTTGTNVTSTDPTAYATTDTLTSTNVNNPEIPSAIFCDMFTVLSPAWATQTNYPNDPNGLTRRQNSFPGWSGDSDTYRRVTWKNANERIEVSACLATGDFPIFEFFPHALEDFNLTNGTSCTPLVVKGAMVSMFTSEVQHIKQAYGRDATKDIQTYWSGHGANNFPSPRLHQFILDGNFPPGTPQALLPSQSNFQVINKNDPMVGQAGF